MAGIFTRGAIDKILGNADLTPEQRTEQIFGLYGKALDDGYISKSAAEEAKNAAVEAAKAGFKPPEIDPKTTPEYQELLRERDMLKIIGGDEFASVKPKFKEQVFGMLDRGEKAKPVSEQLADIQGKYEEYFAQKEPEQPKNTPQYSQQPGHPGINPTSEEDKIYKQLSESWK